MPNEDRWKIQNNTGSPLLGNDLNNMRIEKVASGYKLVAVLATTTSNNPPFTFSGINFDGQEWTITVTTLPNNADGSGTWSAVPEGGQIMGDPTDGSFTAQAGQGMDEDSDEAASSSASA